MSFNLNLEKTQKYLLLGLIGVSLTLGSLIIIYFGDLALLNTQTIVFRDNEDILIGKYHPGSKDAGIILLEGFNSDQTAMKSINSEFSALGFHTFSFDFSGHGRSGGSIRFDNAATDRFANQVLIAKEKFKSLSGLNDSQIILLGHSMGARMALQSAIMDPYNVSGLILIGCQVNLIPNVQAGFFTGVSDLELDWVNNLSDNNPPVDILLLSGSLDDILTPTAANALYTKLGGESSIYKRAMEIYPLTFHNYEIYSPFLISKSLNWTLESLGLESNPQYFTFQSLLRKVFWVTALIGIFLIPIYGVRYLKTTKIQLEKDVKMESENMKDTSELKIVDIRKFFIYKLVLWLGAIPIAFALLSLFFFIPIGIPIFSLIYIGFIGSYGILMFFIYERKQMPGTRGKMGIKFTFQKDMINSDILISIGISLGFVSLGGLFFNSGINFVFPLNYKLIWLLIFTILTIPGFFIGNREAELLKSSGFTDFKHIAVLWLIGLVPFFILSIFFAILGSVSGMIGSIHGIIILIFAIVSGNFISKVSGEAIIASIYQSFLLQFLVLTQCALFAIF